LYGHAPRYLGIIDLFVPVVKDLQDWLQERKLMTAVLRQHLHRANLRMKHFADAKRSNRCFQVGEWVYLRLQPYVQMSRANAKLAFRFFGGTESGRAFVSSYRRAPSFTQFSTCRNCGRAHHHQLKLSIKNYPASTTQLHTCRYCFKFFKLVKFFVVTSLWSKYLCVGRGSLHL
jgi:hypothetical protein